MGCKKKIKEKDPTLYTIIRQSINQSLSLFLCRFCLAHSHITHSIHGKKRKKKRGSVPLGVPAIKSPIIFVVSVEGVKRNESLNVTSAPRTPQKKKKKKINTKKKKKSNKNEHSTR